MSKSFFLSRTVHRESGAALAEGLLSIPILLLLVGIVIDITLAITAANAVTNATRDVARIGSLLANVATDDPRILQSATLRLDAVPYVDLVSVQNNDPDSTGGDIILGQTAPYCDQQITVSIQARYSFKLLSALGWQYRVFERRTSMRYNNGELC